MKKALLFILIAAILVSALSGCTNKVSESESSETQKQREKSTWVNRVYSRDFELFDSDGDKEKESIVELEMVAMSGGHGGYDTTVYAKKDDYSYETVFVSDDYLKAHPDMDIKVSSPREGVCAFTHEATGYYAEWTVPEEDLKYIFDKTGALDDSHQFTVDTFKSAEAKDVDGDGCEEIEMRQFTSIVCHANYLGDCVSTWKLTNNELKLIDLKIEFFEDKGE